MKIELRRKQKITISLIAAAVFGVVWGSLFAFSSFYGAGLAVGRNDLTVENGHVVSAQSLREGTESYVFPPPLYVFEWIEFNVNVHNASGGVLEINFTRDGNVLRRELVEGSANVALSGHGEYRLRESNVDVTFQALNGDVKVKSLYILVNRGVKLYNPLVSTMGYVGAVALIIFSWLYRPRKRKFYHE